MQRINGEANVVAVNAAKDYGSGVNYHIALIYSPLILFYILLFESFFVVIVNHYSSVPRQPMQRETCQLSAPPYHQTPFSPSKRILIFR